jgi:hypothetical protein
MRLIINPQALASLIEDAGARATIDPATGAYELPADIERELAELNIEQLQDFYTRLALNIEFRHNCIRMGLDPHKVVGGHYRANEQPKKTAAAPAWSIRRAEQEARQTLVTCLAYVAVILLAIVAARTYIDPDPGLSRPAPETRSR